MGYLGKMIVGAAVGVGAVAIAPFTGGGSLLAAAAVAESLEGAGAIAAVAGGIGAVGGAVAADIEEEEQFEREKNASGEGFERGLNEGKSLAADEIRKYVDFYLATTALSYYMARVDGSISKEEQLEIDHDLDALAKNVDIPDAVKKTLKEISENEELSWDEVVSYLDKVSIQTLEKLSEDVDEIIMASDGILPEEQEAKERFEEYLSDRKSE